MRSRWCTRWLGLQCVARTCCPAAIAVLWGGSIFLASYSFRYGLIGSGNYCSTIGLIGRLLLCGVLGNFHAVLVYSIILYGQCFSLGRELCVALCVNRPLSFRIQHMLSIFTVGKLELRFIIGQLISFIVWQWCFSLSVYSGSYWSWDFCVAFVNGATSIRTFWCEVPRRLPSFQSAACT